MKSNTKKHLSELLSSGGEDTVGQFLTLLELPDEKFNAIWNTLKPKLDSLFSSQKFQTDTLQSLQMLPTDNIEAERAAAEELISELNSDDTISDNKKEMMTLIIEKTVLAIIKLIEVPRERVKVKIKKLTEDAKLPEYAHSTDAGADIFANEEVTLKPHETKIVPTGIAMAIPAGYEVQVRPRSGLSAKTPLRVANATGTLDSSYRGQVGIIMWNTGNVSYTIKKHDKIAQLLIAPTPMMDFDVVEELDETDRGESGFGSTDAQ